MARNSQQRWRALRGCGLISACLVVVTGLSGDDGAAPADTQAIVGALQPWKDLVGEWRAVGQVRRGSNQGAWQETAGVVWDLKRESTGLRWTVKDGKHWQSALLTFDPASGEHILSIVQKDGSPVLLTGKWNSKETRLVLESPPAAQGELQRVTLTAQNENRVIWLLERKNGPQSFFARVAEIGCQRQGTKLAAADGNGPECIVTGGRGTIAVMHAGQTYYVCCTGCREAFEDDPAGIIAAWKAKRAKKK